MTPREVVASCSAINPLSTSMSTSFPDDKKARRRRRKRPANGGAVNAETTTPPAGPTSPASTSTPAASRPPAPSSIFHSIVRSLAVSIFLTHCTLLVIWSASSTLCHDGGHALLSHGDEDQQAAAQKATCPHTFYAEMGGQCVALVDASTVGDSSAADLIRTDDYSSGILCHDAEVVLTLAQKYLLWPLSPPSRREQDASTCCDSLSRDNDRKGADSRGRPHPIAGMFGHYESGRTSDGMKTKENDNDTITLQRVVSRHRANPSNVDQRHPIRRIVESAATVFGRRKTRQRSEEEEPTGDVKSKPSPPTDAAISTDWARDASSSPALHLDFSKKELVKMVTDNVREQVETMDDEAPMNARDFDERVANVGWGGPVSAGGRPWWLPPSSSKTEMNGERLAAAYAKIMGWPSTEEYTTKFPFKKCAQEGCDPHFAFVHTLEWREKFKPWCITPSAVKENRDSFFYVRGHSPPNPDDKDRDATIGHSLVFYRPGLHKYDDTESYIRLIMHTLDSAVADSYSRSNDQVGKFNIILDCNGFSLSTLPGLSEVKRLFTMMQDHFPDRLGVLMIVNLSGPGQLFLRMIKSIISEAVKKKIHIVAPPDKGGMDMLKVLIKEEFIPTWLGGHDDYVLNAKKVYADRMCTEAEGREYYETMPFHAP